MAKHKFLKYQSVYDQELIVYGLETDGVEVMIDHVKYIEVTPDFKNVTKMRADSLKVVGHVTKEY